MLQFVTIEMGLGLLALAAWPAFRWAFRNLPQERWQFAAVVPLPAASGEDAPWQGINITYYGLISALAYASASGVFVFLAASVQLPLWSTLSCMVALLGVGAPASRHIARWVEGGQANFTLAGALFAGSLVLPVALFAAVRMDSMLGINGFNPQVLVAAAALAYVLGEAIGRLGCLSFGCCYGRPLADVGPLAQSLYGARATVYRGRLKKIAYASNLECTPVVPVQSIASVVLFTLFLAGLWLFWQQEFAASALLALWGSQGWRLFSETLRADYRGGGRITAYQWMAIATCLIVSVTVFAFPAGRASVPHFADGWAGLARIDVLLALQALAISIVLFMGRSQVTGARVHMQLYRDRL